MMANTPLLVSALMCFIVGLVGAEMRCPLIRTDPEESIVDYAVDKVANHCPTIIGPPQDEYCCYDLQLRARCCNINDFLVNMSVLAVVALILLMLLATIISCVCCICCPCCFLYKRRHAGRVYRSEPIIYTESASVSTRTSNEYKPINKTHLPPGAFPVFPRTIRTELNSFEG